MGGYEYYGRSIPWTKCQKIRCPRCNGTGGILWPSDIGKEQIDGDVVMSMLQEACEKMYADLLKEGKLDGSIPEEHYPILQLWELR